MSNITKPIGDPSLEERSSFSENVLDERDSLVETNPLLQGEETNKPTPLPKLQVAALLLVFLPEPVTSTLIYPFIVQVSRSYGALGGVLMLMELH